MEFEEQNKKTYYPIIKRGMDVICSLLALFILSPVFLMTTIAILVEDGRPIFFFQERTGKKGKIFKIYKFRSMCKEAEKFHEELLRNNEMDGPAFKMRNDPRVTKVGRFIRRTSIDELPQLVNIIKGEMSIVGPRPLPTYETEQCNSEQLRRLDVKPGLTCFWQICGRSDVGFDEWMKLDMKYIREASIKVDIKLIFKTIITVITAKGAY